MGVHSNTYFWAVGIPGTLDHTSITHPFSKENTKLHTNTLDYPGVFEAEDWREERKTAKSVQKKKKKKEKTDLFFLKNKQWKSVAD